MLDKIPGVPGGPEYGYLERYGGVGNILRQFFRDLELVKADAAAAQALPPTRRSPPFFSPENSEDIMDIPPGIRFEYRDRKDGRERRSTGFMPDTEGSASPDVPPLPQLPPGMSRSSDEEFPPSLDEYFLEPAGVPVESLNPDPTRELEPGEGRGRRPIRFHLDEGEPTNLIPGSVSRQTDLEMGLRITAYIHTDPDHMFIKQTTEINTPDRYIKIDTSNSRWSLLANNVTVEQISRIPSSPEDVRIVAKAQYFTIIKSVIITIDHNMHGNPCIEQRKDENGKRVITEY